MKMASKGKVQNKPHTSISKVKKICCRVDTCKEEILIQNYERHLERFHPSENKYDKRVFGEKKNFFGTAIFQSQEKTISSKVEITECQGPPIFDEDINENIKSVQEFDQSTSAKRGQFGEFEADELVTQEVTLLEGALTDIEIQVDDILRKLQLFFPPNQGNSQQERIRFKLSFLKGNIRISSAVSDLEKVVKEVKSMTLSEEKVDNCLSSLEEVKNVLVACKSVTEVETRVPEFTYNDEIKKVVCEVCKEKFNYDISHEQQGKNQSQQLVNLKAHLKLHLEKSTSHKTALGSREAKETICRKEENRNDRCGMNLGRTSYYLLHSGRPSSDFTRLLSMQHNNGCDIGDINHGTDFLNKIGRSLSSVIMNRVKDHMSTRLPQTGCLPPCKVVEDSATYRHDTRHLIGLTTIFPGSSPLIQAVFCGAPKGIRSDGVSTAKCMAETVAPYMTPEQYLGTSEDGANFLSHVGDHLDSELGQKGHHDWDGVHAANTVDTALRNPKKPWAKRFAWVNNITSTISKANRFINWGMEWDRFCQVGNSRELFLYASFD